MYPTTWTDQPEAVTELPILYSTHDGRFVIEIRADGVQPHCYITVGTLFGSQSLRCDSLLLALRTANLINHAKSSTLLTPIEGTRLIER